MQRQRNEKWGEIWFIIYGFPIQLEWERTSRALINVRTDVFSLIHTRAAETEGSLQYGRLYILTTSN